MNEGIGKETGDEGFVAPETGGEENVVDANIEESPENVARNEAIDKKLEELMEIQSQIAQVRDSFALISKEYSDPNWGRLESGVFYRSGWEEHWEEVGQKLTEKAHEDLGNLESDFTKLSQELRQLKESK